MNRVWSQEDPEDDPIPFMNPCVLHLEKILVWGLRMCCYHQICMWFLLYFSENLIFWHPGTTFSPSPPPPVPPYLNTLFILWRNRKFSSVVHKSNQCAWFNKTLSPLNELQRYWRKKRSTAPSAVSPPSPSRQPKTGPALKMALLLERTEE